MSKRYYDEKTKEFNDLRMGMLTMEEFVTKFMNLQCYVPYLRDGKDKVYGFISCLPPAYKEKIEFDMPNTLDEAIRKDKLCYHLFKQRLELSKNWKNKKNEKMDQCRKGLKPSPFRKGQEVLLTKITIDRVQLTEMW